MDYAIRGILTVWSNKKLRAYVWRPLMWAVLVYVCIWGSGFFFVVPKIATWVASWIGGHWLAFIGARLIAGILWGMIAGYLFVLVASIFSALLWDRLSLEVERSRLPAAEPLRIPIRDLLKDAFWRSLFAIVIGIAGFLSGGFVGLFLASWICLYDYTSPSMLRRRILFPEQFRTAFALKGALGFSLVSGVLSLVPILNLLMLPGLVVGGTLMVLDSPQANRALPQR